MGRVTGAILAKAFLPSPVHIKESLSLIDLGIKLQMLLYELSASLFWSSIGEIALFVFSFLIFITDPSEMTAIYFHVPHIARGVFGFLIVKKLPNSHVLL